MTRVLSIITAIGWLSFLAMMSHKSVSPEYFGRYSSEYLILLGGVLVVLAGLTYLARASAQGRVRLGLREFFFALIAMIIALPFALILGEIVIRSTDFLGASLFEEISKYIEDLEPDPLTGVRHRPDLVTSYQGVPFRTNEIGMRDRALSGVTGDALRILVLGDSVTLGWGVHHDDVYATQLEKLLSASLQFPVRTFNAGVAGYNTVQEAAYFEKYASTIEPDIAILMYVENDTDRNDESIVAVQERWRNPGTAHELLLRWSWFYRVFDFIGSMLTAEPVVASDTEGWRNSMSSLERLAKITHERDVGFISYLYRITPDETTDLLQDQIAEIAQRQSYPHFDLLPHFENVSVRSIVNSFIDTHPNARGHEIVAHALHRSLVEDKRICDLLKKRNDLPDFCQ